MPCTNSEGMLQAILAWSKVASLADILKPYARLALSPIWETIIEKSGLTPNKPSPTVRQSRVRSQDGLWFNQGLPVSLPIGQRLSPYFHAGLKIGLRGSRRVDSTKVNTNLSLLFISSVPATTGYSS